MKFNFTHRLTAVSNEVWASLLLLLLLYIPIFGYLNQLPLRVYDEARLAVNAQEMIRYGNLLVTYFEGKPDMWNTKPPLMIWMQVLSIKCFGMSDFSIRFPSALAAFATCCSLLYFFWKYLNQFWLGWLTVFVLITSHGYINIHGSRTGDYDALLTFFTTISALLLFLDCREAKSKYLYGFFISLTLGVLTKGITALLFGPAYLLLLLGFKKFRYTLARREFYIGLVSFCAVVVAYYWGREVINPGYLDAVWKNELGGRYTEVIEEHKADFWYYYQNFMKFQLSVWYLLIPCGLVLGLFSANAVIRQVSAYFTALVVVFFFIISGAQTKLEWYDIPMYPWLAFFIAAPLWLVCKQLYALPVFKDNLYYNVSPVIFVIFVGITPYQKIIQKTYKPQEYPWEKDYYEMSSYLQKAVKGDFDVKNQFLLFDGYNANNLFYMNILNEKGANFKYKDWKQLSVGDTVLVYQGNIIDYLREHYELTETKAFWSVKTFAIDGIKPA
ncbi:MAG TPA: glycosyltransferase family 39 protein [Luteibaculaceae bacterium]|nr:glycosyltransferase family 39 protein [Luteibaculaceae bacterium]